MNIRRSAGVLLILAGLLVNPFTTRLVHPLLGRMPILVIATVTGELALLAIGAWLLKRKWTRSDTLQASYIGFFASATIGIASLGGVAVLLTDPVFDTLQLALAAVAAAIGCTTGVLLARSLMKKAKRAFTLACIAFAIFGTLSLIAANAALLLITPPWPASGLHGVSPEAGANAWGRVVALDGGVTFNSWGERDYERTIARNSTRRIAFIGDSFLEESTTIPISVATQTLLQDTEVVNLGVSATGPDEYYYRASSIAMPIGATRCVVFFYEGNDHMSDTRPSLRSFLGIAAVYPRTSVLSALHLRGINHVLTNGFRQVLLAWGTAGELNAKEQAIGAQFAGDDASARATFLSLVPAERRAAVDAQLTQDLHPLFEHLRHPDGGLFRTGYLRLAAERLAGGDAHEALDPALTYRWIRATRDACDGRFTLVIIPEAFQVDDRMRDLWIPLTDMRALTAYKRAATTELIALATADGMDVIDLTPAMGAGDYLSPDGHWSDAGVDAASQVVAARLEDG